MRKSREQMEREEAAHLAPYAQRSGESAGRHYPLPRHPYRTEFQRDRARIIHSRAFRRLEYKTQVFRNDTGDHLRTRLTHTIEVASISRTIARALSLNEDLAEAIALAHDLGHAPFGHPGEETLNRLMQGHGGFDHNEQSLRIVELIESDYPEAPGLNLSFEVIEGLRKHQLFFEPPPRHASSKGSPAGGRYTSPTLEAQIANLADEITYHSHDLDDGLDSGFVRVGQLTDLAIWRTALAEVAARHPDLPEHGSQAAVIRRVIDRQVEDVIATSDARIEAANVRSVADVRLQPTPLISYSPELLAANRELRSFLYPNLYYHPEVRGANDRGCALLAEVFADYLAAPEKLGEAASRRLKTQGLHRTVCDYLAGMTDRYLFEEHARLFGGG
jgi:dGTPase